jgi:hypothetical protein
MRMECMQSAMHSTLSQRAPHAQCAMPRSTQLPIAWRYLSEQLAAENTGTDMLGQNSIANSMQFARNTCYYDTAACQARGKSFQAVGLHSPCIKVAQTTSMIYCSCTS